jgi:hypothetical protein
MVFPASPHFSIYFGVDQFHWKSHGFVVWCSQRKPKKQLLPWKVVNVLCFA